MPSPGPAQHMRRRAGRAGGGWLGETTNCYQQAEGVGKRGCPSNPESKECSRCGKRAEVCRGWAVARGEEVGRPSIKHCACHSSFHHLPALPSSPRSCHLTYLTLLLVRSRLRWILLSGIKRGDSQCSRANCLSRGGGGGWVGSRREKSQTDCYN